MGRDGYLGSYPEQHGDHGVVVLLITKGLRLKFYTHLRKFFGNIGEFHEMIFMHVLLP